MCGSVTSIVSIFKIIDCNFENKATSLSNKWTNEIDSVDFFFLNKEYEKKMPKSKDGHYCCF